MAHLITEDCTGCSACQRQCPVEAISGTFKERYVIDASTCVDCGVCGWICPDDAVLDGHGAPVPRLPRPMRPRPNVLEELCNGCGVCLDYCPFDCRDLVGDRHGGFSYLSGPGRCVGCGECSASCIKGAIVMEPFDLRTFDAAAEAARLERLLRKSA